MVKESPYLNIFNTLNDKKYFIIVFLLLIFLPFIQGVANYPRIPIISDFYDLLTQTNVIDNNITVLSFVTLGLIYAIFAASWDLLSGYTGQFNFGHALFFGFAAYCFYLFTSASYFLNQNFEVNPITKLFLEIINQYIQVTPLEAFFISAFLASFLALGIGLIALRLKGAYFALISLIIPLVIYYAIPVIYLFPGKSFGIFNQPTILPQTNTSIDSINFYYFTLLIFLISMGIMLLFAYSRIGDIFQSIREDEEAAESIGINTTRYKILAFIISAYFAGLAGCLYTQWFPHPEVFPSIFTTDYSFPVIIYVIVGGVGTIYGGALCAILLTLLIQVYIIHIFNIPGTDLLVYGIIIIVILLYIPRGITKAKREQKRAFVLGILISLSWIILSHGDFSSLGLIDWVILALLAIITLPFIPLFIIGEQIGMFILNNIFYLNLSFSLDPARVVRALFLIDSLISIPIVYYLPPVFKKIRLKLFGIWPSIGIYEPE